MHVDTKELKAAVSLLARITSRSSRPWEAGIHVRYGNGTLHLRSTAAGCDMLAEIDCDGAISEGSVWVDGKALATWLRAAKGPRCDVVLTPAALEISDGWVTTTLPACCLADAPPTTRPSNPGHWEPIDATQLSWVALAASSDECRRGIFGVHWDGEGHLLATDGHRMHISPSTANVPARVSPRAAKAAISLSGKKAFLSVNIGADVVEFTGKNVTLRCENLLQYEGYAFPPWQNILRADNPVVRVELRPAQANAWTHQLQGLADKSSRTTTLLLNGTITGTGVASTAQMPYADKTWHDYTKPQLLEIGVNADYLTDALAVDGGYSLSFGAPLDPIRIDSGDCVAVVMPMHI